MYKQIEEYKLEDGVVFKIFKHVDAGIYVLTCNREMIGRRLSCAEHRFVSQPGSYVKIIDTMDIMKKAKRLPKPILYTDFSKMDPNDPLIKAMEKRRPYRSSDFVPKMMIPDLRTKRK